MVSEPVSRLIDSLQLNSDFGTANFLGIIPLRQVTQIGGTKALAYRFVHVRRRHDGMKNISGTRLVAT